MRGEKHFVLQSIHAGLIEERGMFLHPIMLSAHVIPFTLITNSGIIHNENKLYEKERMKIYTRNTHCKSKEGID
jgi:hypothetical protein